MAWKIHILIFFLFTGSLSAQVPETDNPMQEEQLELLSEKQDKDVEDDSYWQELESLRKHPIHLNHADAEELRSTGLLTDLQVLNFIGYRTLLGDLINIYELQSVPGWDLETIRRLLPFVRMGESGLPLDNFDNRWKKGESSILLRASQVLEKSRGYFQPADATVSHYLGSQQHLMFRYDYRYRQLLQFGLTGDKDAGEQFFRGAQKLGFDFYSFHLFSRQSGLIRTLALGDFTVNLGQGLIQWQSLAFSKSAEVLSIKRQAAPLRPYNSPGEFKFHRGIGLTLVRKNWSATLFFSMKKLSTNLFADTLSRDDLFSSLESSGYHRTKNEIEDRNNTGQMAEGMNISYSNQPFHLGFNLIHFQFSRPFQKQDRPYNLFAIQGRSWTNSSIDYSYTYRNLHFFGESAIDPNRHGAFLNAVLISLSARADLALLHRYIHKEYQALYADAFTENSSPTNENGMYIGLNLQPTNGLQAGLYLDMYKFPWLRYQVDGPGWGREYFIQLIYRPNKDWTLYSRYKAERKSGNLNAGSNPMRIVQAIPRQDWRTEFVLSINRRLKIRSRIELLWYDKGFPQQQEGFLGLIDVHYQSRSTPIGGNIRVQWVETSGYASRIYVFENDLLYSYSLPAFYDKALSYYMNLHFRLDRLLNLSRKKIHELGLWFRWGQVFYPDMKTIGSGLDEINGNRKSEFKFQVVMGW